MGKDISKLIDQVADNRRMPREKVIERLKEIVSSWTTRELNLYHPLKVEFNEQEGEVEIYSSREVVEVVENECSQIEFQGAIKIKRDAKVGDILLVRVQPELAKSLLPGVLRELYTGVREEYPKRESQNTTKDRTFGLGYSNNSQRLPRIPDIPERQTQESTLLERHIEVTEVVESEGDTADLISILVDDHSNTVRDERGEKSVSASKNEPDLNTEEILPEIERVLRGSGHLQVKRHLNSLEVEVSKYNTSFTTIFHIYNGIVNARTLLPFVKGVSVELLTLCGQADFISSVGIVLQKDKPCYSVKNAYPVGALSRRTIWEMVSQVILDASKAIEIINAKKPLEK
jgi:hypothetical protein